MVQKYVLGLAQTAATAIGASCSAIGVGNGWDYQGVEGEYGSCQDE